MSSEWVNFQVYQELQQLKAQVASIAAGANVVGSITPYGGATAPTNWLLCQGDLLLITAYPELYAVIGLTYTVGSPAGQFALPDLSSRFPYGKSSGGAALGTTGGTATLSNVPAHTHTLTNGTANVSSVDSGHSHTINAYKLIGTNVGTGDGNEPNNGNSTGTASAVITSTISGATDSTGTASVDILPPYLTLNYIICYTTA
jgi:microcystin-dependent protein